MDIKFQTDERDYKVIGQTVKKPKEGLKGSKI